MKHLTEEQEANLKAFAAELGNDISATIKEYGIQEDVDYFDILEPALRESIGIENVDEPDVNEFVNTLMFELDDKIQAYWGYL
jgi:hypothetical protein